MTLRLQSMLRSFGKPKEMMKVYKAARIRPWWETRHMNYVLPTFFMFGCVVAMPAQ